MSARSASIAARIETGRSLILGAIGTMAFFGLWEIAVRLGWLNHILFPAPSEIYQALAKLWAINELQGHLVSSIGRILAGYGLGSLLGIALGVMFGRSATLLALCNPLLQMGRSIPPLALVPLVVFWMGLGEVSKVSLIAWASFFPVWINTMLGVKGINPLFIRAGSSLGARRWRLFMFIVLPSALPLIFAGLRVSLSVAFNVLVAAELAGALSGVGYLIQSSALQFRVDNVFVGIVLLGALGFIADLSFIRIIYWLFPWYRAEQTQKN